MERLRVREIHEQREMQEIQESQAIQEQQEMQGIQESRAIQKQQEQRALRELFAKITEEYSERILDWAVRKAGCRRDGEDLAQEVLLQVFISVSGLQRIEKLENFIWKVARYVWCNHVRTLTRRRACELSENLPDGGDFAGDYAEGEALKAELSRMRRGIADLSRLQREAVILRYIDGLPVRDVAKRLNIAETAAAWHLFDARKKVKKELESMEIKNESTYVYSPGNMRINASGGMNVKVSGEVPQYPDTNKINDSLLRQNICLLCRGNGKTIDELVRLTGVPKTYVEHDVDWLAEREFLLSEGKRYLTSFIVMNRSYFEYRRKIYTKYKGCLCDIVVDYLFQNEDKIRGIGFYGSDFPAERLMWAIITMFISYASRNSGLLLRLKSDDNREIHMDGGKYHVMAFDGSDGHRLDISGAYDGGGWENFYGIACDNSGENGFERYFWLGVYNFADEAARPEIVAGGDKVRALLYELYCGTLKDGFSPDALDGDEKEKLAETIEGGLIRKDADSYKLNFAAFTKDQLMKLQSEIYAPLLSLIEPKFEELADLFDKIHRSDFPKAKQGNIDHHKYLDLWMFGIFTLMFAATENRICLPEKPADGAPLTLILVTE